MRKLLKNTVSIVLTELHEPSDDWENPSNEMTAQLFHCWKANGSFQRNPLGENI